MDRYKMSLEDKILGVEDKKIKKIKDKSNIYFADNALWELQTVNNQHYIIVTGTTMKTFMPPDIREKVYEGENNVSFNGYSARFLKRKK